MKKSLKFWVLLTVVASVCQQSCMCSCHCDKEMGCKILEVKSKTNNQILLTKSYCSEINFLIETALSDSVTAFAKRYETDTTLVTVRDSVFSKESVTRLKCNETDAYTRKNYFCNCAK